MTVRPLHNWLHVAVESENWQLPANALLFDPDHFPTARVKVLAKGPGARVAVGARLLMRTEDLKEYRGVGPLPRWETVVRESVALAQIGGDA